jgi:hypothetical protein
LRKIRKNIDTKSRVNKQSFSHKIHSDELPVIESSGIWYRFVRSRSSSSLYFVNHFGRFSSDEHSILYVAEDPYIMFCEIFGRSESGLQIVTENEVRSKKMFEIKASLPLLFADFTGNGLSLIGEDILSIYGQDYDKSRQLAEAIWAHPMNVDGIKYRSRYDLNRFSYAIFDRAARYLSEKNLGNLVDDHPQLLRDILDEYNLSIISDSIIDSMKIENISHLFE